MSFAIGQRVAVSGRVGEGTVRFAGTTQFSSGHWIGIELDTADGRNNGSVNGVVYFECAPNHGVFARPDTVRAADAPLRRSRRGSASRDDATGSTSLAVQGQQVGRDIAAAHQDIARLEAQLAGMRDVALPRAPAAAAPPRTVGGRADPSRLFGAGGAAAAGANAGAAVHAVDSDDEDDDPMSPASFGGGGFGGGGFGGGGFGGAVPRAGGGFEDDAALAAAIAASYQDESARQSNSEDAAAREQRELLEALRASREAAGLDGAADDDDAAALAALSPPRRAAAAPPAAAPPPAAARFGGDFGGGGGPSVPDDEDAMLQHALALSRGEDPAAATHYSNPAGGGFGGGGFGGGGRNGVALDAARAQAMAAMGLDLDFGMQPPHAALPPPRIPGLWSAPLQCVSAEAFERPPEGDKVLLPPSALEKLMELIPQEHMPQPLLFRISVLGTAGAGKHVGVLEFSAPEGCVVVPLWIMRSLGANDGDEMFVGTAELPKGSFAKLQPLSSEFAQLDVSPKELLERTLAGTYTTLATGDSIAVNYGGMMLELFVLELQEGGGPGRPGRPANAVCIIDADLEVDFEASAVMSEEELRRRAEAEAAVQAQAEAAVAAARAQEEAAEAARRAEAEAAAAQAAAESRQSAREEAAAALPPEPPAGDGTTTVLVRMPDGPRISRRFLSDGPLSAVRAWVDANSPASRAWAHGFELVSNFPRFVASADNAATTIAAAGLAPQVTFMVKEGAAPQ